jgi:hypothetical protein
LIGLWKSLSDPSVRYKLALFYLHKGDSVNCFSTLNSIPQINELSPVESGEFEEYSELLSLLWPLRDGTINPDSLTADQLFTLSDSKSVPGALARNILMAAGFTEYQEPIYLSTELKSSFVLPEKRRNHLDSDQRLKIYPNPTQDYFILTYDLTDFRGSLDVEIINSEGKVLFRQKLSGIKNQLVISTAPLPASSYTLRLINETSSIEALKFIILR